MGPESKGARYGAPSPIGSGSAARLVKRHGNNYAESADKAKQHESGDYFEHVIRPPQLE